MKYRVITNSEGKFIPQYKNFGIWWSCDERDTLEEAEKCITQIVASELNKKNAGRVVKEYDDQDIVAWKLKGKI
jgi:hypothetical protein